MMKAESYAVVPAQVNTNQLGRLIGRSPAYIRNSLSSKGHFWQVVPVKTPSGSLLWNLDEFRKYFVADISGSMGRKQLVLYSPTDENVEIWRRPDGQSK
jgi:hypothetical protein